MKSTSSFYRLLGLAALAVSPVAQAQEASVSLEGTANEEGADATAGGAAVADNSSQAPERTKQHPFEIGLFGGLMFPSSGHSLGDINVRHPHDDYSGAAFDFGARIGVFPIDYLGIEGELAGMPTTTEGGDDAFLSAARVHLIGQLPLKHLTPFVLIGGGRINTTSDRLGDDSDRALHFGAGVKVPLSEHFNVRLDLRDTISDKQYSEDTQHWPEVLLGAGFAFGSSPKPVAPPPPVDTDGDGLSDGEDACPMEPAQTPDGCPVRDLDSDGDGVLDSKDECPKEAGDLPNGCPNLDSDGDGVPIPADQCPEEKGTMDNGCPDLDPDGDGVPLPADKCPEEPETANGYQDSDGCPDTVPEAVKKFTGVIKGILFDFGKATVSRKSYALLDGAVKVLADYPELRLSITGHTDSVGSHDRNVELSLERANSVKQYLVDKGIEASRLEAKGAGPDEPIADNKTRAGRKENRRIEFKILQ